MLVNSENAILMDAHDPKVDAVEVGCGIDLVEA